MYEQEGGRVASSAKPSPIVSITMRTPLVETALVWIKLSRMNRASRVIVVRSIRLAGSNRDPRITNQFVICSTLHAVEEPMARWLLMNLDRAGKDDIPITHDFLSELLGVRRQTISVIAGTLQCAGLITYRRGVLRVLDRLGLEDASCQCYDVLKKLYDRIVRGRVVPASRSERVKAVVRLQTRLPRSFVLARLATKPSDEPVDLLPLAVLLRIDDVMRVYLDSFPVCKHGRELVTA